MADLFDSVFDTGDEEEASPGPVDRLVQELDDEDIDEEMQEAQRKLAKAAFYRAIVTNGVVEENGTREATEVNAEFRVMARRAMVRLLRGENPMDPPTPAKVELPFSETELAVLKLLAAKAQAAGMVPKDAPPPQPTVKQVKTEPKAPQVRKIKTSLPAAQQTQTRPQQPQKPQGKPKPIKPPKTAEGNIDYDSIPSGQIFKDQDGKMYKFVDNPNYDPDRPGSKPRGKISVQQQQRTPGAIPMPNMAQMEQISHSQAQASFGMGASADSQIAPGQEAGAPHFIAAAADALRRG